MTRKKGYSGKLIWEKVYPLILSFIFFALYLANEKYCWAKVDLKDLIRNSLSFFGALLGFLITVLTVINSLDNIYIQKLRALNSFRFLINYLKFAIKANFLILVYAILYLSLNFESYQVQKWIDYSGVFIFFLSLFSTYRFIDTFLFIINTE